MSNKLNLIRYKLTNQNMTTHKGHKWELNKTYSISKENVGTTLCTDRVFHYYTSPELAILLNPMHADINNPRLFKIRCDSVIYDGLKGGSKRQRFIKELKLPIITNINIVAFGLLCALEVCYEPEFRCWASNWLSGKDRTTAAADVAYNAATTTVAANVAYAAYAVTTATTATTATYATYNAAAAAIANAAYATANAIANATATAAAIAANAAATYNATVSAAAIAANAAIAIYNATVSAAKPVKYINFNKLAKRALLYT
jgi:hypothetical protein